MVCPLPGSWINHVVETWTLDVLGCFGRLAAFVRLSNALVQWMLWKVLEALGVFERYGRLLEGFRKPERRLKSILDRVFSNIFLRFGIIFGSSFGGLNLEKSRKTTFFNGFVNFRKINVFKKFPKK